MKMQNPATSLFPQAAQRIDAYWFMLGARLFIVSGGRNFQAQFSRQA